ncbi:MAG: hypothetical protein ABIG28_00595 [archaeon]
MKNYTIALGIILVFVFLFISFVSWTEGFAVHSEEDVGVGGFSFVSPLLIGLLIIGVVVVFILMSVG